MKILAQAKTDVPRAVLTWIAAGLLLGATAACAQTENSSEQLQKQYLQQFSQQIDTVVASMSPDLFESDPFFSSRAAANPDGKLTALALSREQAGENRWLVMILNKSSLDVTQVYDYIRAYHLNKMEWCADGAYLLMLAEDVALSGPPGSLSVIDPKAKRAYVIDRAVWQYDVSPDGRDLAYERCEDATKPLGRREVYHTRFDRLLETLRDQGLAFNKTPKEHSSLLRDRTTRRVMTLDYPREQLEGFKSWSADSKTLHLSTYRYGAGATQPARVRYAVDLTAGKASELR